MNEKIFQMINPQSFPTPFCPGCGHGILMGAVLRAIAELEYDMKQMLLTVPTCNACVAKWNDMHAQSNKERQVKNQQKWNALSDEEKERRIKERDIKYGIKS